MAALGPSLEDDTFAPSGGADAIDDLWSGEGLGDEARGAGFDGAAYESLLVREAEDDDGAGGGVGDEVTYAFVDELVFAIGVQQGEIGVTAGSAFDVDLDDADVACVSAEKRSQTFQDDVVVVFERDACGHQLRLQARDVNHPFG